MAADALGCAGVASCASLCYVPANLTPLNSRLSHPVRQPREKALTERTILCRLVARCGRHASCLSSAWPLEEPRGCSNPSSRPSHILLRTKSVFHRCRALQRPPSHSGRNDPCTLRGLPVLSSPTSSLQTLSGSSPVAWHPAPNGHRYREGLLSLTGSRA